MKVCNFCSTHYIICTFDFEVYKINQRILFAVIKRAKQVMLTIKRENHMSRYLKEVGYSYRKHVSSCTKDLFFSENPMTNAGFQETDSR